MHFISKKNIFNNVNYYMLKKLVKHSEILDK